MELTINNVTKRYSDKTAVNEVNLTLVPGVWGLLGANGAGKTTLMRIVAGILAPTSGEVLYDGVSIATLGAAYRDIFGYLPQTFGFYPSFTVVDYLHYVAALKGLTKKEASDKIDDLLVSLTLSDVRRKRISRLSGGMQRRVGIAQAMLNDPDILILDEPTSGLDPGERVRFRKLLTEFAQARMVLISTHIVSDVEYIATKNAVMKDGEVIAVGTTDELVQQVKGKVWETVVPSEQAGEYEHAVRVVNLRNEANGKVTVRYVAEREYGASSMQVAPHLEDLYLWLFEHEEKEGGES
ncbi:MAG: ABC transporter ATP-binding protein [Clostridia bacterium]|nr:ABC transporter ATP-binding protein [Clostridia bacterium]